jgi:hypothetical protein
MPVPENLSQYINDAQWRKLGLDNLDPDDRQLVLGSLEAAFKGIPADELDATDISDTLEAAQELADELRVPFDDSGYDKSELHAAAETAKQVVAEMNEEEK